MHRRLLFLAILGVIHTGCAYANDDVQYVKSVKGGHGGGFQYNAGANLVTLFGNRTQQGYGHNMRHNLTTPVDYEIGVCYKEVPTASLVRDTSHVPAGNGSRPDLSRIRTCCQGYIRNIHNYWICEPVCSKECVNSLCTAPEVCTCFPDHVKNLAGYCVATCPIGCQNGHCDGGECLCKEGYKLDSESKFCIPSCKENCGGIGNCTSPNTCECKSGYHSTTEGSCKPVCERCVNGDCVAPNECRCRPGYTRDQQGQCAPHCPQGCGHNGRCISPNVCDIPPNAGVVPGNQHSYYPGNQLTHQSGNQPPQPSGNQLPYQPGSYNSYQPGNQSPYQPGSHTPYQSGNQPSLQPGNQPPFQPGNQPPYQPGNQPPYQPGNQPPYQPGNQPPYQPGNPGNQSSYYQVNYPGNPPPYTSNQQVQPDQQNSPFPPSGSPQCSQPCLNGVCVEGNRCACNSGYVLDKTDPSGTRCVPNCPGGCPNGVCSAPNFCICNMGYYKDHSVKGRPSCVKRVRRSADLTDPDLKLEDKNPINVAELLIFDIPDY